MIRTALIALLLAVLLTVAASAQVTVSGVLRTADLPTTCQQGTHLLDCAPIRLQSGSIDLDAFVGKNVKVTGVDVGVECPVLEVTRVQSPAPTRLTVCGSPVPGCPIRFRSAPGALSQHILFASAGNDLLPTSPFMGAFLLGSPFVFLDSQLTAAAEGAAFDFVFPADVALTGITVFVQSARRDVGPIGPFQFSNAVCFTILGPSPPCILPDC